MHFIKSISELDDKM